MKFTLADPEAEYRRPLRVALPSGTVARHADCTVWLRLVSSEDLDAAAEEAKAAGKPAPTRFQLALRRWEGIHDVDGTEMPVSDENRLRLERVQYFARAVLEEYARLELGLPGKTSEPLPEPPGPASLPE